ncbi:hypothetical protein CS542_06730 [Pedobacter sp. IW39]|nr:hypothetical protein CS542_06730 [Pedobacter sp. IW39]
MFPASNRIAECLTKFGWKSLTGKSTDYLAYSIRVRAQKSRFRAGYQRIKYLDRATVIHLRSKVLYIKMLPVMDKLMVKAYWRPAINPIPITIVGEHSYNVCGRNTG